MSICHACLANLAASECESCSGVDSTVPVTSARQFTLSPPSRYLLNRSSDTRTALSRTDGHSKSELRLSVQRLRLAGLLLTVDLATPWDYYARY